MAIVMASHELDEIQGACDRVAVFDRGQIVATGAFAEVRDAGRVLLEREAGEEGTWQA